MSYLNNPLHSQVGELAAILLKDVDEKNQLTCVACHRKFHKFGAVWPIDKVTWEISGPFCGCSSSPSSKAT